MIDIIKAAWEWIKKVFVKIVNFAKNIVSWFQDPTRIARLEKDKDLLAVAVKQNLENGNYNTVKCLFNKKTNKIEGVQNSSNDYAEGMESEELDSETKTQFGKKNMLILE